MKKKTGNLKDKNIFVLAIVACLALVAVFGIYMIRRTAEKAEYLQICDFDFNTKQNGYVQMKTNAYSNEGTTFSYDETGGMDGTGCVVIDSQKENDARFTYKYSDAKKNTYYRFSVWVKTENVGTGAAGANLSVLDTYSHSQSYTGDTDWTYIEYYGKTAKDQTEFTVCLRLGFYGGVNTGKVYFDDFKLEQLDKLPEGARADAIGKETGKVQSNAQHDDTMLTATIILIYTTAFFIVAYRYAKQSESEIQPLKLDGLDDGISKINNGINGVITIICIGFILRIVMSFTMPQCDIDVNLFQHWANNLAEKGITNIYSDAKGINLDYPPLFLYYLNVLGHIGRIGNISKTLLYDVLLKLPSIVADCAIAFIIYKIASKRMNKSFTMFIVAAWMFNPVVILDSACWGQVDSILALFILLAAYFIEQDKYALSAFSLALAITLKPQGIFFVPILGYALLRQLIWDKEIPIAKRLLRFAYSIAAFIGTAFLIVFPFGIKMEPNIIKWVIGLYSNTAGGYTYATVNSFNFFYLMEANWVNDAESFMGLTYFKWGMIAIVVISLLTGVLYIMSKKKKSNVYIMSAMLIYAVTQFAPRMHERYFYPAVILLLVAVIYSNNKILMAIYGILTLSNFYTVIEVMTGLSIGGALINTDPSTAAYYYWPPLNTQRAAMGVFNVLSAAAIILFACYEVFTKEENTDNFRIWEDPTDEK